MRKTIVSLFMMLPLIATTAQESKWSLTPQVGLNLTDIGGKDAPDIYANHGDRFLIFFCNK